MIDSIVAPRRRPPIAAVAGVAAVVLVVCVSFFALRGGGPSCTDCTASGWTAEPAVIHLPSGVPDLSGLAGVELEGVGCTFDVNDPSDPSGPSVSAGYARFDCPDVDSVGGEVVSSTEPGCGDMQWTCFPNQGLHCKDRPYDYDDWLCVDSTATLRVASFGATEQEAAARVSVTAGLVAARN